MQSALRAWLSFVLSVKESNHLVPSLWFIGKQKFPHGLGRVAMQHLLPMHTAAMLLLYIPHSFISCVAHGGRYRLSNCRKGWKLEALHVLLRIRLLAGFCCICF